MLASLLPGLRELRTPLTVGWLCLITAWVAFGDLIPKEGRATGVLGSMYDLASGLGKATILGVLAFVAYLIGSLLQTEPRPITWIERIYFHVRSRFWYPEPQEPIWTPESLVADKVSDVARMFGDVRLADRVGLEVLIDRLKAQRVSGPEWLRKEAQEVLRNPGSNEDRHDIIAQAPRLISHVILDESTVLRTRLLAKTREVYDFYDRLLESADLRINLAAPVTALGLATGVQLGLDADGLWSGLALGLSISLLALAMSFALLLRSSQQYERSRTVLATAVASDLVESPFIEAWRAEWTRRSDERPPSAPSGPLQPLSD